MCFDSMSMNYFFVLTHAPAINAKFLLNLLSLLVVTPVIKHNYTVEH